MQRIARETEQAQTKLAQAKADLAARKKAKGQKLLFKQQREKENVQFVSPLCMSEPAPAACSVPAHAVAAWRVVVRRARRTLRL